jgi:hypothetical protein
MLLHQQVTTDRNVDVDGSFPEVDIVRLHKIDGIDHLYIDDVLLLVVIALGDTVFDGTVKPATSKLLGSASNDVGGTTLGLPVLRALTLTVPIMGAIVLKILSSEDNTDRLVRHNKNSKKKKGGDLQ